MSKKIFLVDDEKDMIFALKLQLEAKGYVVSTAEDGQTALTKIRKEKPDLVVLDLMLPGIDGYQVCRMLKFDESYNKIPIVLLTARAQQQDKELGEEVGADAYVTKPFDSSALLQRIEELLGNDV